jgi:hypothetical protein
VAHEWTLHKQENYLERTPHGQLKAFAKKRFAELLEEHRKGNRLPFNRQGWSQR